MSNLKKRNLTLAGSAGLVVLAALTIYAWTHQVEAEIETADTVIAVLDVAGMTCGGCEVAVRGVLKKLDGVRRVEASHEEGKVSVDYDPAKVRPSEIEAAIEKLGYKAELREKQEMSDE